MFWLVGIRQLTLAFEGSVGVEVVFKADNIGVVQLLHNIQLPVLISGILDDALYG